MRARPTFVLVLATLFAALAARAAAPAKTKAAPKKEQVEPFKDEEHTDLGQRFKTEPHTAVHHTAHGAWVKKPPVKHVPISHTYFRKLPTQNGQIALPNGQKIAPADFHAGVNHAERALNSVGHSLKTPGPRTKIGHHDAGHATHKTAQAAVAKAHKPNPKWKKSTLQERQQHHAELIALRRHAVNAPPKGKKPVKGKPAQQVSFKSPPVAPAATAPVPSGPPQWLVDEMNKEQAAEDAKAKAAAAARPKVTKANTLKSWDLRAGDPKHFSAYVFGKAETRGDADSATFHAESTAGGSAFGYGHELLKLTADFTASRLQEHEARIEASVGGSTVYTLAKRSKEMWSKTDRVEKTIDVSATVPIFSLGIISVTAKVGVQGTAGLEYGASIGPGIVGAHVTPYVRTGVYVQASVNVIIAEAGAIGKLTLLNDSLELTGSVALVPKNIDNVLKWGVYSKMQLHNNMEMLNGEVSAFVKLYFPCWTSILPSICNKQWDVHLFGWKGFQVQGDLFQVADWTQLDTPVDTTVGL